MKSLIAKSALTMSSLEIAELTGKEHPNVMRDIRRILKEAEIGVFKYEGSYLSSQNKSLPCYNLPKFECDLVISGYSVPYRAAIIKRWVELESRQHLNMPNFNSPAEAARAWAEQYEQAQLAIKTKAEIGSRREATAMNTASQAVRKANQLERELDRSKEYFTVKRMELLCHGQKFNWRLLKSTAAEMGLEPIPVFDANYGTVKAYHANVWREAYALEIPAEGGAE